MSSSDYFDEDNGLVSEVHSGDEEAYDDDEIFGDTGPLTINIKIEDSNDSSDDIITYQCIFNKNTNSCRIENEILNCPSISECISELSNNKSTSYEILIPSDFYFSEDCPSYINNFTLGGNVSFISTGTGSVFNCGNKQFLNVTLNQPTSLTLKGLTLTGYSSYKGGCLGFTGNQFSNASTINIIQSTGSGCVAGYGGGFLDTDISSIFISVSSFYENKVIGGSGSGGVIFAPWSNVTIEKSTFVDNSGSSDTGVEFGGVGWVNSLQIDESSFVGNHATKYGGCFYVNTNVTVNKSKFFDSTARYGGAILSGGTISVSNSFFTNNTANTGGCIMSYGNITVVRSEFKENYAYNTDSLNGQGGVIYTPLSLLSYLEASITIDSSRFESNSAVFGGAVYGKAMNITNSQFYHNFAFEDSNFADGGVLYTSTLREPALALVVNCAFENNRADYGAIFNLYNNLTIDNCSFNNNTAKIGGGAIYTSTNNLNQTINVFNSSFFSNHANGNGGAIYMDRNTNSDGLVDLSLVGSTFSDNTALGYAGSIYFLKVPNTFVGGMFADSASSEPTSTTFYSESIQDENIVSFSNSLQINYVPIFYEYTFNFWKALGAKGNCTTGIAVINAYGDVIQCN